MSFLVHRFAPFKIRTVGPIENKYGNYRVPQKFTELIKQSCQRGVAFRFISLLEHCCTFKQPNADNESMSNV
jgi:hypothetical protein